MKLKRSISLSLFATAVLITSMGLGGCGGTTKTASTVAPHMTSDNPGVQPHIGQYSRKVEKNNFDPNLIEWEFDNSEGLKIHLDDKNLVINFTHHQNVPNIQFFIDTDNNINTGNREENGADYMVENGYLYKSTDPSDWKWQEIGAVKVAFKTGEYDAISIPRSQLNSLSTTFGINAQALDEHWEPKAMSPIDGGMSIYTKEDAIDWKSVPLYTQNGDQKVKVFSTNTTLYIRLEQTKRTEHIQIYIDSDNNPSTGYKESEWSASGMDFLAEDGTLYRYTGVGDWGWDETGSVYRVRESGNKEILEVAIPKTKLTSLAKKIKIGVETNNKNWDDTALIPEETIPLFSFNKSSAKKTDVHINEVMAANTHTILDPDYYNFSDWIELYNAGDSEADLSGYSLSDKLNKPKWHFPAGTTIPAHGYLLVWADNKDKKKKGLHTNFKLKTDGEAVALFDPSGTLIEGFAYQKQLSDVSVVYEGTKAYYMNPTPGSANTTLYESAVRTNKPVFSKEEGFYQTDLTLSIDAPAGSTIYYTTDGSIPDTKAQRYNTPIPLSKTSVIRAVAVSDGKFVSDVVTKSYIIDENIGTDIAVVSIAVDNRYLYDDTIGIYTIGTNGKELGECEDGPQKANFFQKWERPAHMTFFENNHKAVLSQDIGLKVAGQCSRIYAQKSFQLKADDKYGKKRFNYRIFPDKAIQKYKRLKLRNAGQDFIKTHMRDALQQMLAKGKMHVNYEAYIPAIVFINGKFWGVYNLREKMGKEYLEENYGEKKVNLIEDDLIAKEGSLQEYDALIEYLQNHSLVNDEEYQYVASKIDIDNYIDYMIANIYGANADWPGTNLVYWKPKKGGKWQWLLHDMDFGFALYSENPVSYDALGKAKAVNDPDEWPNPEWSTLLFRKLLENNGFKTKFKNRFLSQLDTTYAPARVKSVIDSISSQVAPYMQRHIQRWTINGEYSYKVHDKSEWEEEVQKLKEFADQRPAIVRQHIQEEL